MGNVVVVALVVILVAAVFYRLRYHGQGVVARRGLSIGADLAGLADQPRVCVRGMTQEGGERVRILLTPFAPPGGDGLPASKELDLVVELGNEEFGFELLQKWQRDESPLALVLPPDSRLVRLRSIDDLQHLTLKRAAT